MADSSSSSSSDAKCGTKRAYSVLELEALCPADLDADSTRDLVLEQIGDDVQRLVPFVRKLAEYGWLAHCLGDHARAKFGYTEPCLVCKKEITSQQSVYLDDSTHCEFATDRCRYFICLECALKCTVCPKCQAPVDSCWLGGTDPHIIVSDARGLSGKKTAKFVRLQFDPTSMLVSELLVALNASPDDVLSIGSVKHFGYEDFTVSEWKYDVGGGYLEITKKK